MSVRLQTDKGEIKEYQTFYGVGSCIGDVSEVDKWITKCGREWDRMPESHQECDHVECAIRAIDSGKFNLIFGFPFLWRLQPFFPISEPSKGKDYFSHWSH